MLEFLNIFSLILGFTAVILPLFALLKKSPDPRFSFLSFSACILALVCQIGAYNDRIDLHDWTALLDTYAFTGRMALYLMIAVLTLNSILYGVTGNRK